MQGQTGFKFNWGHGILVVILIFLISMTAMMYVASRQSNEMVDDHYYQKELVYQGVIDAGKNLRQLTTASLVHQSPEAVVIQFPAGSYEQLESGNVELQRNDAASKDLHLQLPLPGNAEFAIPKSKLFQGLYKLKVSWTNNHVPYFYEENVLVDK